MSSRLATDFAIARSLLMLEGGGDPSFWVNAQLCLVTYPVDNVDLFGLIRVRVRILSISALGRSIAGCLIPLD